MGYYRLLRAHLRFLSFAFLLNFCSGVGQTFFLALFVPSLIEEFSLTNARFGTLFSGVTLAGGLFLPFVGRAIDTMPLRRYALAVGAWVIGFCWLIAGAWSLPALLLGLWGLRLAGHGLFPHASATVVARGFERSRGRALSLSGLGYPLGEAFFPLVAAVALASLGWRQTWALLGLGIACLYLPLAWLLVPDGSGRVAEEPSATWLKEWGKDQAKGSLLRDKRFVLLLATSLAPAFFLTPLFLYQGWLASQKGWSVEWMASCFVAFAAARFVSALVVGPLIDRWGAAKLYPIYLVPFALGIAALVAFTHPLAAVCYLAGAGITVGMGGNLKTALWVELYGLGHLGFIRGLASSLVVVAAAAGPLFWGHALDLGLGARPLLFALLATLAASSLAGALVLRRYGPLLSLRQAVRSRVPVAAPPAPAPSREDSPEYAQRRVS